jgi:cytidine deaminase
VTAQWTTLIDAARRATEQSHAPYSGLAVGAAVRTRAGGVYVGSNVENASLGLSICAERLAVFRAVTESDGADRDDLLEAAVAVDRAGNVLSPCGACRQVILEFGPEAEIHLPAATRSIGDALAEPFERTALDDVRDSGSAIESARGIGSAIDRVLALAEDDRILLMRLLVSLRQGATERFEDVSFEKTRAAMFVKQGKYLVIPPGFFSNFENPEERTIRILFGHGITGGAYLSQGPNFGVPCSDGALHLDPLPAEEQRKVDDDLKWVAAWPLANVGAVSVDGFDSIGATAMRGISEDSDLKKTVDLITKLLPA